MSSARCRQIVLGIGNAERGDDAAGRTVVRLLLLLSQKVAGHLR